MSISRRDALVGATAAAVITGATVTPLAIKAASANDAHLEALYAEWRGQEATWLKANEIADNAHLDAIRADAPSPKEGDYANEAELEAAWDSWRAASKALHLRHDVVELKRRADVAYTAQDAALHRFIEAQAEGPRGVLVKITAFIEEIEVVGMDTRMLETIRNDLERLAQEAPRPA